MANQASADYAHGKAVEEAIVLAALIGNVWPSADENFVKKVMVQIIDRITSFAIHARRTAEIINGPKIQIKETRWIRSDGPVLETDFWTVVNKILHSRNIEVVTFEHGATMFTNLGDRIITHIEVQSDRGSSICFCGYGLVYAYLSQIAPTTP
ncbi:hypothetical protein [Shinella kummerowiae]|uniref:hypothetical protein n=1 Tax=Shinella kummerowiae TaxID=417745 RepID=UPI0021B5C440|nr:hypothetical protein [Shinella kummerowiae]MCT7666372.1 hypothetical protein [Shinella kummerowiae]